MKRLTLLLQTLCLSMAASAQALEASFMASEATNTYWHCGFDADEEFDAWDWVQTTPNDNATWSTIKYGYFQRNRVPYDDFLNHNPNSVKTLYIGYSAYSEQDEIGYSENIHILPNSNLGFWIATGTFITGSGIDLSKNYDFTVCILDQNNDSTLVLRGSQWVKDNPDYSTYMWKHVNVDMSAFAGQDVKIQLHYWGMDGDGLLMDDFEMTQKGGETGVAEIFQGQTAHFVNYSKGSNLTYQWEFPGGTPSTSTAESPIVSYLEEGTFDVRLTVSDGSSSKSVEHKGYVNVSVRTPETAFEFPANIYHRVAGGCFIPNNTPIVLKDVSANYPTDWQWTFNGGASITTSNEPQVEVYYPNPGYYSFKLTTSNKAGESVLQSDSRAIKVGGAPAYVWNITDQERSQIGRVMVGDGEGYFAGSNTRRIIKFAELFDKPLSEATISKVGLLFLSTANFKPDTTIVVTINARDEKGMPGKELGRSEMALKYCKEAAANDESGLTDFTFEKPVVTSDEFFVVISGIPPYEMDHMTKYLTDEIYLGCSPIRANGRNTTYMMADSLAYINGYAYFTNNYLWEETSGAALSMGVAPYLSFASVANVADGIQEVGYRQSHTAPAAYYDLRGRQLADRPQKGLYIIRRQDGKMEKHMKH